MRARKSAAGGGFFDKVAPTFSFFKKKAPADPGNPDAPDAPGNPDAPDARAPDTTGDTAGPMTDPKPMAGAEAEGKCTMLDLTTNAGGLSVAFLPMYKILFFAIFLMYITVVQFALWDLIVYQYSELRQSTMVETSAQVYIADSTDYRTTNYPTSGNTGSMSDEGEPYSVYICQKIIGFIRSTAGVLGILIGINLFIYFVMFLYKQAIDAPPTDEDNLGFDSDFLKIVVTVAIIGISCKLMYDQFTSEFVDGFLARNRRLQKTFAGVGEFAKNHLPLDDADFLANLVSGDNAAIATQIASYVQADTKNMHLEKIAKILFACDMYNYFVSFVPITDPMYNKVQQLFSADGANHMDALTGYFYYKGIGSIPSSSWSTLRNRIQTEYSIMKQPNTASFSAVEKAVLAYNYTFNFNGLFMTRLHPSNLSASKGELWKYLTKRAFIASVFMGLIILMNYTCLAPLFIWCLDSFIVFIKAIWAFIQKLRNKR
jgi:hypothetical protein